MLQRSSIYRRPGFFVDPVERKSESEKAYGIPSVEPPVMSAEQFHAPEIVCCAVSK